MLASPYFFFRLAVAPTFLIWNRYWTSLYCSDSETRANH